jgi:hypothetical protein
MLPNLNFNCAVRLSSGATDRREETRGEAKRAPCGPLQ